MKYAKVKNNKVIKVINRPNWFIKGEQLTDDLLIKEGIYPIKIIKPDIDPLREKLEFPNIEDWVVSDTNVTIFYRMLKKSVEEVKNDKLLELKNLEASYRETFIFTNSNNDKIEIKIGEDSDRSRISWLNATVNMAIVNKINNQEFNKILIDKNDQTYTLTIQDWLSLGEQLQFKLQNIIDTNKLHTNTLNNFKSSDNTVEDVLAYDIHSGWI